MNCKHCGNIINDDSNFCKYCGKPITPTNFTESKLYKEIINLGIRDTIYGKYIIAGDNKTGFIILNIANNMPVFNSSFQELYWNRGNDDGFERLWVKKNGKWGYVNASTGIILCDFIFDHIWETLNPQYDDAFIVSSNDLCGSVDYEGNVKLPIVYDDILSVGRVKYQGLWGVVREGKQIIPCEYLYLCGELSDFGYDGFGPSQYKNGKWGVINIYNGEIILEFEFDEIRHYGGAYYEMRKGEKWGAFLEGKLIYQCEFTLEEIQNKRLERALDNLFFH